MGLPLEGEHFRVRTCRAFATTSQRRKARLLPNILELDEAGNRDALEGFPPPQLPSHIVSTTAVMLFSACSTMVSQSELAR